MLIAITGLGINIASMHVISHEFDGPNGLMMLSFFTGTSYVILIAMKVIPKIDNWESIAKNWFGEDSKTAAPVAFAIVAIVIQSLLIPFSFIGNMVWILLTGWLLMKRGSEKNLVGKDKDGEHVF